MIEEMIFDFNLILNFKKCIKIKKNIRNIDIEKENHPTWQQTFSVSSKFKFY